MMEAVTHSTNTNPWLAQPARILRIRDEGPGVRTYGLQWEDPVQAAEYRFQPGQFNMLYLPGIGEAAISLSSDPAGEGTLSHTVRVVGNVTTALARKREGDQVALRGPFGTPWPIKECLGCDLVLACGGVGLAPLRPVIYHVLRNRSAYGRVWLLYGARTSRDLLFTDEYDAWREQGIEVEATVDIGDSLWRGTIGVVPSLFYRLRLSATQTRVFTCGPEIMMRFVAYESLARKIRKEHIFVSLERNMNCAMGFCGHCQFGPTFVCKDGPTFTYARMEPFLDVEDL